MKIRKRSVPTRRSADIPVRSNVNVQAGQLCSNAGPTGNDGGLTLIEVLVVTVVAMMLILVFLAPMYGSRPTRALRIQCVNNLKQAGLAFRIWEGDHTNFYPQALSETNGGTMEFTSGPNAFRHFQAMSNELSTPKILFCPAETDHDRLVATNFINFNNSNISYFVGIVSNDN